MPSINKGFTDQSFDIYIEDASSTSGAGLTGLLYNSADLKCNYRRGAAGLNLPFALVSQTVDGAHTDGGFVEVSNTGMPGVYRFDGADSMFETGVDYVSYLFRGAANMVPCPVRIDLLDTLTVGSDDKVLISTDVQDLSASLSVDIGAIFSRVDAARRLASGSLIMGSGSAEAGTLSTTQMSTDLAETNPDQYKDRVVVWTAGVNMGQAKQITAYDGAGVLTYSTATDAPSAGDTFIIV